MSESIKVPFEGDQSDQAVLLLAAAHELGLEQHVVTVTAGAFVAPAEVVEKAFGKKAAKDAEPASVVSEAPSPAPEPEQTPVPVEKPTAKKAAAKRPTAKKATKRTPAKRAAKKTASKNAQE